MCKKQVGQGGVFLQSLGTLHIYLKSSRICYMDELIEGAEGVMIPQKLCWHLLRC